MSTDNSPVLSVKVDGETYNLSPGDFTALDDLAVKRAVGLTLVQVFQTFAEEPALYGLAALLWRYRVNSGEPRLTFEEVAAKVNFDAFRTVSADEAEEDAAPLASDGS